jgi:23S rRNA maturation mini-RNase III
MCMAQLYVRRHYFFPPSRLIAYYEDVTSQVRAETQVPVLAHTMPCSCPYRRMRLCSLVGTPVPL